jgi:hypothetical protein
MQCSLLHVFLARSGSVATQYLEKSAFLLGTSPIYLLYLRQLLRAFAFCARLRVRRPGPLSLSPRVLVMLPLCLPFTFVDETLNDDIRWAIWWTLKHSDVGGCFPAIAL